MTDFPGGPYRPGDGGLTMKELIEIGAPIDLPKAPPVRRSRVPIREQAEQLEGCSVLRAISALTIASAMRSISSSFTAALRSGSACPRIECVRAVHPAGAGCAT